MVRHSTARITFAYLVLQESSAGLNLRHSALTWVSEELVILLMVMSADPAPMLKNLNRRTLI